jgi:hypothetical protein
VPPVVVLDRPIVLLNTEDPAAQNLQVQYLLMDSGASRYSTWLLWFKEVYFPRIIRILCSLLFCDIYCSLFLYCANLTEGFQCIFLSCKANARV